MTKKAGGATRCNILVSPSHLPHLLGTADSSTSLSTFPPTISAELHDERTTTFDDTLMRGRLWAPPMPFVYSLVPILHRSFRLRYLIPLNYVLCYPIGYPYVSAPMLADLSFLFPSHFSSSHMDFCSSRIVNSPLDHGDLLLYLLYVERM
ncbi:hypothetical protein H4582DRAFT_1541254 [Lactarius indigo]|nr:hypothetical protein H4582DRAFT_1541254 [Lactarius indigo]